MRPPSLMLTQDKIWRLRAKMGPIFASDTAESLRHTDGKNREGPIPDDVEIEVDTAIAIITHLLQSRN